MIKLSIRRPVAVSMAYMGVALLGVFAWKNIPIERLPNTNLPQLTISASWSGSSPETVEAFLTSPIEAMVQQIRGVEKVTSTSREGSASVGVNFAIDTDMDFARLELSERISQLRDELPDGVSGLTVTPYVPREFEGQNQSFLRYTFTGPYSLEGLQLHLEEVVIPELQQIQGVGQVTATGARNRILEIRVDEARTRAIGLNPSVISSRIAELDMVQDAGAVREGDQQRTITIVNRPGSAADIGEAIIARVGERVIRVTDVATIRDSFEEARQYERINRSPAVRLLLYKEHGTNTVKVTEAAKAKMVELERLNPFGSEFILEFEESEEIQKELADLRARAVAAAVVIFFVLLIFLGSLRSAALIFATIAFSVLISLNLIYFGGLTLNLLTLMGLALGFGLIVDNSIVVLENVYRRWQGGEKPFDAAEKGAKEVVLPIFASTATTLIVFVPFVYLQGELRIYYVPLAIVVALTLSASIFVAFTFIPSLAARWMGGMKRKGTAIRVSGLGAVGESGGSEHSGKGDASEGKRPPIYVRFYEAVIGFNLRYPAIAIIVTLAFFGGSWFLFDRNVTTGRTWGGGGGTAESYIDISINLERGSNLERSDQLVAYFEERLAAIPEVDQVRSSVTMQNGRLTVTFPDSLEFSGIPVMIKDQMYAYSHTFTGADVRVYGRGPAFTSNGFYGGGGSAPTYRIKVLGYNYETVREIAEDLGGRLLRIPRVQDVDTNASGRFTRDKASEFILEVDRSALARYDMTVEQFHSQARAAIQTGGSPTSIKIGGEEVDYQVKIRDIEAQNVMRLREALIQTPSGKGIRLGDVATIRQENVLSEIRREDQQYERTVAYEFRGPNKLGDLYRDQMIEATVLPPGYSIEETSGFYLSQDEKDQINLVLAISILLVFMVTAALFESLKQPFAVLLTVPMALIGVFFIFFFAEATFTREAYVGVIMMGGIVVNNAILLVDHINRVRREEGLALYETILKGTLERVRPILMTTATTVFGLLPLVLFSETADSSIWNALAFVLIGGLLSSTLFVLTVTPVLYWLFERKRPDREWVAEQVARTRPPKKGEGGGTLSPPSGPEPSPAGGIS